ncbi:heme A synthase [Rufibacter radiotolerans]|uniref:Heme A synthase n=1 Tax=Rufibacter radiotolerans TaxID=1379910 RepID=A0A0H4W452_9BACT|nr:COX15/CtaA family protein [Rufibacter radiotolerans]AKQ45196.1 heme A synthase [Rufibacter radiotolerans]
MGNRQNKAIILWLLTGAFLIVAMVVIGGITRLTGSGLSMVEWKVISGAIPPLNEAEWQLAFHKYQQFPEFQKVNFSMTLSGFKQIFWWEYLHRLLGRVIGLVFIIPFLYFLATKQVKGWLLRRLLLLLMLGMGQGLMGWVMVKSGLVDNPHVSHYRLAAHLFLALALIGVILWTVADLLASGHPYQPNSKPLRSLSKVVLGAILLQILLGAFVAGLKAGFSYNSFPLMNGELYPRTQMDILTWQNFMENGPLMQFLHRWVAMAVLVLVAWFWYKSRQENLSTSTKNLINLLLASVLAQVLLGVVTLLWQIPVTLGVLHQVVAVAVFAVAVLLVHQPTDKSPEKSLSIHPLKKSYH